MAFKKFVYFNGPRMGTNNFMYGVELKDIKGKKSSKTTKTNKRKK